LLREPDRILQTVWDGLGVDPSSPELDGLIKSEMDRNPDADWQNYKESDLAANLRKGMAGSWRNFFTDRDKEIFKEIGGETLIAWDYEQDLEW
jgi:hypothetical protein